jgi:hypothetical protein
LTTFSGGEVERDAKRPGIRNIEARLYFFERRGKR